MSNIIPPMVSSTPPPVDDQVEEDEDDEFGDFRVADHAIDFNRSNDSTESPDLWTKPFSPSPTADEESTKSPEKIPNGVFTPMTDEEEKECDSPQHLNLFIQPVSDSITEKLPEIAINEEEVQSNPLDISDELKSDDDDLPQAQENIPDDKLSLSSINDALNPNEGCDINSVNRTEDFNEEFRTSEGDDRQDDCEFSDFADFTSVEVKEEFVKSESPVPVLIPVEDSSFNEDDFEDFECADFESAKEPSLEETLQTMFPHAQEDPQEESENASSINECLHSCLDDSSSVWGQLKELETSHALSYQWSNSSANKCLLSSLNIDSRYVLYGSRWNASIPRFAANLGFSPLEPVKASEPPLVPQPPPPPQTTSKPPSVIEEVVPAAQFDWTSSGLTNPLDCLEKEIIPSTASAAAEQTTQGTVITINREETIKNDILSPVFGADSSSFSSPPAASGEISKISVENHLQNNHLNFPTARVKKKEELTPEAYKVVESFPDLSFLSARKLMCTANENMNRWRTRP